MAKWVKGQSGCKTGRGKGNLNKKTKMLALLLEPHSEELISTLIKLARGGDSAALRMCIERIMPVPKSKSAPTGIELPSVMNEKNIAKVKKDILAAVLSGSLSADEGTKIIILLDSSYAKPASTATINFSGMNAIDASKIYQQIMRSEC